MIDLIPPEAEKIEWSPTGIKRAITDWINTPHPADRIIPSWQVELLMGLVLMSPILLAITR